MVLMQITEPGSNATVPMHRKVGLGIDLGTTNSLVAHFDEGKLTVFEDDQGRVTLPSVVHYAADGHTVGYTALAGIDIAHTDTLASVKRFIGRSRDDVSDDGHLTFSEQGLAFTTSVGPKTPVEVSGDILQALKRRALDQLPLLLKGESAGDQIDPTEIDGVVITVPAYFDDAQRQATRQAAELAGLKVLRLLNEPTAAAVAYGLDIVSDLNADDSSSRQNLQCDKVIAVYDLGGGTFDISILKLSRGVFEVLATGGDSALGGDDFDRALADYLQQYCGLSDVSPIQRRKLLTLARATKEVLTNTDSTEVDMSILSPALQPMIINRETFEGLCVGLVDRTLDACRQCILDAGVNGIDEVVLVGGGTRMPMVARVVETLFERKPLCTIDPDQVVAMGAARQANILVGNRGEADILLLDVTALSLGVETYGGLVERIVPRNTTIPLSRAQEFTTARDGQTGLNIHVMQGERERVENCRSLARFELTGIPPMVAGAARIRVAFKVDADGLLEVSAREETTGRSTSVTVKPSFGLKEDDVASMLRASYEHAEEDMEARQLAEARVEAEQLIASVEAALDVDEDLLSEVEATDLCVAIERLRAAAAEVHVEVIREAVREAGCVTEVFAQKRMDRSIKLALGGMSLSALDEEFGDDRNG